MPYLFRDDQELRGTKVEYSCKGEFPGDDLGGEVGPFPAAIEYDTVAAGHDNLRFFKFGIGA